jgi:hypothetical protein
MRKPTGKVAEVGAAGLSAGAGACFGGPEQAASATSMASAAPIRRRVAMMRRYGRTLPRRSEITGPSAFALVEAVTDVLFRACLRYGRAHV